MKIYLDTNIFCRPFDNQSQKRIRNEAIAFLEIIENVINKKLFLISSEILEFEIGKIKNFEKRIKVSDFLSLASDVIYGTKEQLRISNKLEQKYNLKGHDALHVAAAFLGKAEYMITCDDLLLEKVWVISSFTKEEGFEIKLINPISFLKVLKGE